MAILTEKFTASPVLRVHWRAAVEGRIGGVRTIKLSKD